MTQKERAIIALGLSSAVFFLNLAGGYFSWYSSVWWYDILMHFTGGLMVGTVALLFSFTPIFPWFGTPHKPKYWLIISIIISVIIFWEILEFSLSSIGGDSFIFLDSVSDMCLGLSGSLFVLASSLKFENIGV